MLRLGYRVHARRSTSFFYYLSIARFNARRRYILHASLEMFANTAGVFPRSILQSVRSNLYVLEHGIICASDRT